MRASSDLSDSPRFWRCGVACSSQMSLGRQDVLMVASSLDRPAAAAITSAYIVSCFEWLVACKLQLQIIERLPALHSAAITQRGATQGHPCSFAHQGHRCTASLLYFFSFLFQEKNTLKQGIFQFLFYFFCF